VRPSFKVGRGCWTDNGKSLLVFRPERKVEEQISDERERAVVLALRDACEASLEGIEERRRGVRAMDVWVASFV
jgi:hypothetical protein